MTFLTNKYMISNLKSEPKALAVSLSILNQNKLDPEKIFEYIVQGMGMSACQARCLRCQGCSNAHAGSSHG